MLGWLLSHILFENSYPTVDRIGATIHSLSSTFLLLLFHWHYSPMRAFASIMDPSKPFGAHISVFLTGSFLRRGIVNLPPNPQPGGPGPIFITPGTGRPSYTPKQWVATLVAFYDIYELTWDYSLIPVTTRH